MSAKILLCILLQVSFTQSLPIDQTLEQAINSDHVQDKVDNAKPTSTGNFGSFGGGQFQMFEASDSTNQILPEDNIQERSISSYIKDMSSTAWENTGGRLLSGASNQLLKLLDNDADQCESYGRPPNLMPTEKGLEYCENKCTGITSRIQEALTTFSNKLPRFLGNGKFFVVVPNESEDLPEYECLLNLSKDALLCSCPRASKFYVSSEVQNEINRFLVGDKQTRDFIILPIILAFVLLFCGAPIWIPLLLLLSPIWIPALLAFG